MAKKEDVVPDPSTGDDDVTQGAEGQEPEGKTPEGGEKPKGRTVDNVYHELTRKLADLQAVTDELLQERRNQSPGPEQPAKKSDNPLDDIPLATLRANRKSIPAETQDAYDQYLIERQVKEQVGAALGTMQKTQAEEAKRLEHNTEAMRRYPELGDKSSEFRRAVDRKIREWGDRSPRAVLDAANDVAAEMGVTPSRRRSVDQPPSASDRGGPPRKQAEKQHKLSKEEGEKIASRLQGALRPGKKFDIGKIQERTDQYNARINSRMKG